MAANSDFAGFGYSTWFEVCFVLEIKVFNQKKKLNLIPKPRKAAGTLTSENLSTSTTAKNKKAPAGPSKNNRRG
jgi:hypothetical protein